MGGDLDRAADQTLVLVDAFFEMRQALDNHREPLARNRLAGIAGGRRLRFGHHRDFVAQVVGDFVDGTRRQGMKLLEKPVKQTAASTAC